MKGSILIITILLTIGALCETYSQPVSYGDARLIAQKSFGEILSKDLKSVSIDNQYYVKIKNNQPVIYIFNESDGGFVIVSGEERTVPVLAYSYDEYAAVEEENWNPEFAYWMQNYFDQIDYIRENDLAALPDAVEQRGKLQTGVDLGFRPAKDVAPLLSTTWSQGCGYNAQCPVDAAGPCGRVYTGCVATAMAQVLRYMEYPSSGVGNKCYTHYVYGEQCAYFSAATYSYSTMTNGSGNSEVAELMYHCGVSVSMNYSPTGSGAYSHNVVTALKNYFDYKNVVLLSKGSYSNDNWNRILRHEIDNNRPFYYSGSNSSSGHAFVFDGYQGLDYFHINWGWGGSYNGYFYCNDLTPGSYNYNSSQTAVIGAIPSLLFTDLDVSSAVELSCATPLNQDLATGNDYINYYKNTYPATPGKELVYYFTTTLPGRIRVKINNVSDGSLNAFLLSHPHQDSLITYGANGFILDDTEPGTYWLAVESSSAAEPVFDIEVICPTIDAELIITGAGVTPQYLVSEQENVNFLCHVKNIGNTTAVANTINYYLSDDNIYDAGFDTYLGTDIVPELTPGSSALITTILDMPAGLIPGSKNIVYVVDESDIVPEADNQNEYFSWVTVPVAGHLDCSSSVSLADGVWYYDNTELNGVNNVEDHWTATGMTAPEIIHSFVAPYNGMATISFTEKVAGEMKCMVYPVCNENTWLASTWFANLTDTLATTDFYVTAGTEYFVVVDSKLPVQGEYGVKADLPAQCPEPEIHISGETGLCDGDPFPGFWTSWGFTNYQWYKDGLAISDETMSSFTPDSPGTYYVEIVENSCAGQSDPVTVSMSFPPDTAQIVSSGLTEFCDGGSVILELDNTVLYPLQWTLNGEDIPGANGNTCSATEPGIYALNTINGSCSVESLNNIEVSVNTLPVNIGEQIPFPSDSVSFYYTFDENNTDVINNYTFNCWDFFPADDRNGNFWQARDFTSAEVMGYSANYDMIPSEFTLAYWFKTETEEGGMLSSFVNNPWGPASQEAVVYMSDDGKIHYWMSNGGSGAELTSADSYNDGNWHSILITHDTGILMEIDNGSEFLSIATTVTHQDFNGYWTFAGPVIPATVSSMPTSQYFNGAMDDILCANESKYLLRNYLDDAPELSISVIGDTLYCDSGLVYFNVENSQNGIEYKVWNNTLPAWHPSSGTGNGGDISIGGTVINETTEFLFYAVDPVTLCETLLDTSITVSVYPTLSPVITISSDGVEPMCEGTTINFSATVSDSGYSPYIEWYFNGILQSVHTEDFSFDGFIDTDTVFAVVISDYYCANPVSDTSNEIVHTVMPLTNPSVSITSDQTGTDCQWATVHYTANPVNCGSNPVHQWYHNGVPVGADSDTYTTVNAGNDEEIYVIVTNDLSCTTSSTAESNHMFTDVYDVPQANLIATGGVCHGDEICLTYSGETAGVVSIEWDILDGIETHYYGPGPHCFMPVTNHIQVAVYSFDTNGCFDSVTNIIDITGVNPEIDIFDTIYHCPQSYAIFDAPSGYDTYHWSDGQNTSHFHTGTEGLYYLTVANSIGCFDVDSLIVMSYEDHGFEWPEDTTVCLDETLYLGTDYVYNSYDWFVDIWHYTDNHVEITYTGLNPVEVALYADDDHCSYADTMNVYFEICDFVDLAENYNISVYPNPVFDKVHFESEEIIDNIVIIDLNGKVVYKLDKESDRILIDAENWAKGEYYFIITTVGKKTIKSKFIKI